jgi:hypothetical protein|nr:MAG TPA: hypothetical protein [Caudoviricetes sp.]
MQKLTEEYVSQLKRGDIMAFDVATHCGYYTLGDYGTAHFPNTEKAPKKWDLIMRNIRLSENGL